jgi:translation initiation factor 1
VGKKGKKVPEPKPSKVDTSEEQKLTHNPFASLVSEADRADPEPGPSAASQSSGRGGREDGSAAAPKSGAIPFEGKVVLRRETKGRGGKTVTRVQGLPQDWLETLAHRMKKALGCGAKVEGEDVLLQGALLDRAASWLEQQGARRVVKGN